MGKGNMKTLKAWGLSSLTGYSTSPVSWMQILCHLPLSLLASPSPSPPKDPWCPAPGTGRARVGSTPLSSSLDHFRSVTQSCPTLCDPMNCSTPGLPVHHQLPEFTQTHVHRVSDAIQPSHPLSSPSPPVPNPSQHQGLFQ